MVNRTLGGFLGRFHQLASVLRNVTLKEHTFRQEVGEAKLLGFDSSAISELERSIEITIEDAQLRMKEIAFDLRTRVGSGPELFEGGGSMVQ